jgi:outer membrane protein OmpA-like peptidoglycan-associated protein
MSRARFIQSPISHASASASCSPVRPLAANGPFPLAGGRGLTADALFDFDQAELRPNAVQTLTSVGPLLQERGQHPVTVEGHTDAKGSEHYNRALSQQRAASVRNWLVAAGYVRSAAIQSYGETRPVAPNEHEDGSDNPEGRQKNRRVEILVDECS